ncbi:MAG: L,D-transpeptidase [Acetobacter aceti]|uniref:YkuD domain-containing protein n=1 Tax=Acetobacter aceti TaxID=435 RepID=A0A1U9KJZ8_ACEAC|nr:L,D-transpeptidase [Acetobacter aceti]AQS86059.1 hypothetical protein A0U92_16340 [Acetobacter aceti]
MSQLVFDGTEETLVLIDKNGKSVGSWHANNRTDSHATLHFVPNGSLPFQDRTAPHRHSAPNADTVNGEYGSFGIIRMMPFDGHAGVGVHAGRANTPDKSILRGIGPDHVTQGCIRTTEDAMKAITGVMAQDPLLTITVKNNRRKH